MFTRLRWMLLSLAVGLLTLLGATPVSAQDVSAQGANAQEANEPAVNNGPEANFAPPAELEEAVGEDTEVLARGPLHEAFATPNTLDPVEQPVINREPPEPIDELLPEHKPAGDNVIWIPGYWEFDQERDDFIWISGLWRNAPPNRQWMPGYWNEVEGGYQWVPGAWVEAGANVSYYPKPPESQERGASSRRPSSNHFYVPGCWVYRDQGYRWRPGYWAPYQRNWVWVPARYVPAAHGYVYVDGYWDYRLASRGQLFAPVYFRDRAYANANFRYRPVGVIDVTTQLLLHLFVYPSRGQYVYGDYYGDRYANRGYRPWYAYARADGYDDPLLSYYAWRNGGDFVTSLRGWNKYFSSHEEYRPRRTLRAQLAFAAENPDYRYLNRAVTGNTLDRAIASGQVGSEFTQVTEDVGRNLRSVTNQFRDLTGQRSQLERQVDSNVERALRVPRQALELPQLPGRVRSPGIQRNVPDNPLNLRDATPQTPLRPENVTPGNVPRNVPGNVPSPRLPDIPQLPGLPF